MEAAFRGKSPPSRAGRRGLPGAGSRLETPMPFRATQQHIDEYQRDGVTVFRRVLPASLVTDLRRVADRARELARQQHGPQAQRLQPLAKYELDPGPLTAYLELPELIDAVHAVLSPRHAHSAGLGVEGILFEPAERPWATNWHRDWRDHAPEVASVWRERYRDLDCFNQVNCALYDDDCTWVVAGSHLRSEDTPGERDAAPMPQTDGLDDVETERVLLDYCRNMPGAVQLRLGPGDYALYRNTLWHIGNYRPYQRRATLHDVVETPAYRAWRDEREAERAEAMRKAAATAAA
jgi:ectoine hydroxylase-related dioxygenase (phytanoyl-CoA dioxygenase family)